MYFALMIIGLVLTSCGSGGSPSSRANDLCDCLKEAGVEFDGINDLDDLEKIGDKMEKKKGQKCVLAVMEGVDEDISDMDDKETGEYLRDFLKAMIDTDCASEGMEEMEFGDMKKQLKKEIKRMKRRMKDGDDDAYMEETPLPMLALTYIIMMSVATTLLREQLLRETMKTTMMKKVTVITEQRKLKRRLCMKKNGWNQLDLILK